MTTLYVQAVDENSWSRTTWTGGTNYVVGDRVTTTVGDGGTYDALLKTYVCIADNNSTTDPGSDPTNWVRAGESKEYPYHAPGGLLHSQPSAGEVFLDNQATRYKSTTNAQGSFWWHAQNYTPNNTEPSNIVLLNGSYSCQPANGSSIAHERLNFEAESQLKVTIDLGSNAGQSFFAFSNDVVSTFKGIKFLVAGGQDLFIGTSRVSFENCTITDGGSEGDYVRTAVDFGSYSAFTEFKNCLIDLPNASTRIAAFDSSLHPITGEPQVWENTTFAMQWGNTNNFQWFYQPSGKVKVRNCIFYILGFNYSNPSEVKIASSSLDAENSIFYSAVATPSYWAGSANEGLVDRNPLFIDGINGDFRLRPSSPLIGGGESSKFPADAVWMQEGSGTGTGTESDPYYFDQFTDALIAAVSTNSKQVVCKDGAYRFTTAGEQFRDANLGAVTFIAENRHKAVLSAERGVNPGPNKPSFTFKLKDFKLTIGGSEHFIHTQFFLFDGVYIPSHITFDNCYINYQTFMSLASGSTITAKSCIIERASGGSYFVSGHSIGTFNSCLFVDRNSTSTSRWNHSVIEGDHTFRHCLFRTENTTNTSTPAIGTFISCGAYNHDTSSYNSKEFVFNEDPLMVNFDVSSHEDSNYELRPNSPGIGGMTPEDSAVYYLQPGNTYNGDGSQKDASTMTADGDAGPFNAFKNIVAAGVPYGSKIIIVDGTYSWPAEFDQKNDSSSTWQDFTYAGYNYVAETSGEVIFDGNKDQHYLSYHAFGGTPGSGTYLDLDTSFKGVIFQDVTGSADSITRNMILTLTDVAGKGSLLFDGCQFLRWTNTGPSYMPLTGGGRTQFGSVLKFHNCIITYATEGGGLFSGGDGMATNEHHGNWEYINNTIVVLAVGDTTFNGRNGTYIRPSHIFSAQNTSQHKVEKNIIYLTAGTGPSGSIGSNSISNLPNFKNNLFFNIDLGNHSSAISENNIVEVDPLFVDIDGENFSLRPQSPLIGKG